MTSSETKLYQTWEKWASVPHNLAARICNNLKAVELTVSWPHAITNKTTRMRQMFQESEREILRAIGDPTPLASNVYRVYNRDETRFVDMVLDGENNLLSVETCRDPSVKDCCFIYSPKSIAAPPKLHTKIAVDCLAMYPPVLSDDGTLLFYIAEPAIQHSKLPWEYASSTASDRSLSDSKEHDRFEFDVNFGNWGEQCVKWHQPRAYVCDLESGTFSVIGELPGKMIRQIVIMSVEEASNRRSVTIILNALDLEPRRLGMLAFSIREATIWEVKFSLQNGEVSDVTERRIGVHLKAPRDLTVNPVDQKLWCVEYGHVREHHGYGKLVNVLDSAAAPSKELCLPLIARLDQSPWANSDTLYVNQLMEGCLVATAVNLSTGQSTVLPIKGSIVAFKKTRILSRFEGTGRIQLHFGGLDSGKPALSLGDISPYRYKVREQCLILERADPSPKPTFRLGLHLHGGPNSAVLTNFSPALWFMMEACAFDAIVLPNYRGSLGYGTAYLEALAGHVGHFDVEDCRLALIREIRSRYMAPHISSSQLNSLSDMDLVNACREHLNCFPAIVCMGGSHGGFLTGHLIGQHPLLFKAALAFNPVMDAAMHTTDVPDWAAFQFAGVKGRPEGSAERWSSEHQAFLREEQFKKSPIRHVANVRAATFIAVGSDDQRVDPHQGENFYFALKELNQCRTVLYRYPGSNHSLQKAEVAAHLYTMAAAFLLDVLAPSSPAKKPQHWMPECLADH